MERLTRILSTDFGLSLRSALLLFLAAVLIRGIVGAGRLTNPARSVCTDSQTYLKLAAEVRHGHYSTPTRAPGYPVMLAALSWLGLRGVLLVQILLDGFTCLVAGGIAWHLARSQAAAIGAGILYGIAPLPAAYSTYLLSETLFTFLLALGLWAAVREPEEMRWRIVPWVALLFGLAAVTRSLGVYLFPVMVLIPLRRADFPKRLTAALMTLFLPALFGLAMLKLYNRFEMTPIAKLNLFQCELPGVLAWERNGGPLPLDRYEHGMFLEGNRVWEDFRERYGIQERAYWMWNYAHPRNLDLQAEYAVEKLRHHSGTLFAVHAYFAVRLLFWPADGADEWPTVLGRVLAQAFFIMAALSGLLGLGLSFRHRPRQVLSLLIALAYLSFAPGCTAVDARFRVPLHVLMASLGGFAVAEGARRWQALRARWSEHPRI